MLRRFVVCVVALVCVGMRLEARKPVDPAEILERSRVWTPTDTRAKDLTRGPRVKGAFDPDATVACEFVPKETTGKSPKFLCRIGADDEVKVKYGRGNGEVYGEVLATRLLWALGFGADAMYPVSVRCHGCPAALGGAPQSDGTTLFDTAVIERKLDGSEVTRGEHTGWSWPELDLVDEDDGGAPRSQRDALKLLAVFMQHTDNKPEQQRLLCRDGDACREPLMMISDVGLTFGAASLGNENMLSSVNLPAWSGTKIWKGDTGCIGNLPRSLTGTLKDPVISEEGRRFLASRLAQLSDAQLRDLFTAAHVDRREGLADAPAAVGDWVRAFRQKQREIEERRCGDTWAGAAPPTFGTGPIRFLQAHATPAATGVMNVVSLLGYLSVYIALATLLAFAVRLRAGAGLLLLLTLTGLLTNGAKVAVSFPRPDAVDPSVHALSVFSPLESAAPEVAAVAWTLPRPAQTMLDSVFSRGDGRQFDVEYGFPSGHVAAAAAFFLGLALLFGWRWAWGAMLIWVPLMAASRVYLGRHFLGDTLGGLAVAVVAAAVAVFGLVFPRLSDTARAARVSRRTAAVALGFAALALWIRIPDARDAGHFLGVALAVLLIVRHGDASNRQYDNAKITVRAGRVALAAILAGASYWAAASVLEATGANRTVSGALMAGAVPLFVLLAGPFYAERALSARTRQERRARHAA